MVDFLNEIIYFLEAKKEVYEEIKFKELSETKIEGILYGKKISSFSRNIKAATYHNLELREENGVFKVTVLFDI